MIVAAKVKTVASLSSADMNIEPVVLASATHR
jgi:hypothetical protein